MTDLDYIVESDREPLQMPPLRLGEVERGIGEHVAALVPDGATIQWGVGVVPEAVVAALRSRRDLGVHSGFISSVVVDLVEAGIVTNLHKSIDRGRMVATVVGGDMRLYRYLHENPIFELHPADYTHNIRNLCQLESFIAINSAIEVDLTGQVNAETVAGVQVGGVGGQLDFVRGASASKGGRSFTVLPATASGGRVSRIVPRLAAGAGVTAPRHDTHFVVTEYGVADLRGKTLRQRAEALIAIAHPSFRAELEAAL